MREMHANQVILVSGESGSGKTESTKLMVKHFVHMCHGGSKEFHDKIVKINPLLEAFGNAKTVMNHNSSRFAKYLELSFREDGHMTGAVVRDYMIEKSRVVLQNESEGNFHIFYSLFAGAPPERMRELNLKSAANYKIMQSCSSLLSKEQTRMYKKMYEEQMDVLESLDMEIEELDNIHFILAAIIHLTEVTFIDSQGTEGGVDIVNSQPDGPLGIAADLLDLQLESLGHALISMTTDFAGTVVRRFKSMEQAEDGRDAMAKALYERLFGWLVRQINQDIHPQKKRGESAASIGILDIAGFEKMKTNSFEQLCINMVNERLQNFMNDCLFKIELAIYKDEGIAMDNITFENNDPTIELFMKNRYGLFAILDEQTRLATGSAQAFVSIMNENLKDSDLYTPCEGKETMFGVRHFAGQIWYDADQFLEKNRDMLSKELVNCLKGSTNELISDLFTIKKGPTGTISATQYNWRASRKGPVPVLPHPKGRLTSKLAQLACDLRGTLVNKCGKVDGPALTKLTASKDHKTVVSYFQQSMSDLLGKMRVAEPFFIRCIKPNFGLVPKNFEDQKVLEQLVYTGVTGIAKIRRDGYAVRRDYPYFLLRYCRPLWPDAAKLSDTKEATRLVLLKSIPQSYHQDFRLGKYKVFMKEHVSVCMEKLLFKKQQFAAGKIATYYMQYLKRKKEKEIEDIRRNQSSIHSLQQDLNISSGSSSVTSSRISNPYDTAESKGSNGAAGNTGKVKPVKMGYRPPSPPVHIESEEEEPEEKKEAEQDENLFWDIFRVITREIKDRDVHAQRSMKIIKLITYFCFFCILLFAVVTQKISLMTLMFNMKVRDKDGTDLDKMKSMSRKANSRYIIVLVGMCIPYLLAFLTSLFKALFGNMPMPKIKSFVFCLVMESLHTFGLCQLTFRILPNMGMIHGILLLSSVAILPSILRLMCTAEPDSNKTDKCFKGQRGKIFSFILDLLVFFIQISSIPILVISKFMLLDDRAPIQVDAAAIIECVLALFFVSFSWWENFVDDKFCGQVKENKFWHKFIFTIKFDLQMSRPFINFITSAWKIGLSFLLAWAYRGNISFDIKDAFVYMDYSPIMSNASIIAFTISGFVAYYIAYVSCKLHLQIVSFALPLLLSTPVAVAAVQLHCEYGYLSALTSDFEEYDCVDLQGGEGHSIIDPWYHLLVSILWYLSLYWLARHIWFPSQERLAKVERIFLNPLYCGILTEQHFVLNRRRHNRNITRNWKYLKTASGEEKKIITFKLSKKEASPDLNEMEEADSANPYNAVKKKPNIIPTIYACATMWHENTLEMVQLMKSLFRLDKDQFVRKIAGSLTDDQTAECYEFEAHILFDDSMELNDDEERVPNDFVKQFVAILEEAASSVHEKPMTIKPPTKIPSPYGGQLIWELPFGNLMYLHMKDKNKIRHRKRWSQVMYMYYLLGYRIVRQCQEKVMQAIESDDFNTLISWDNVQKNATGNVGKSQIFEILDEEVNLQAANTYILALDGDVDFTPGAVRLLLDRMAKNEKVGAACGRIHPIGRGPMVWYQKFEYAVAHWLQKSTEHVLGCVLCSPGCFSLFRGSALMDDNVMRKYTIMPTEASHHLMYDQGEDRWLCTLLLQQGYRVDYAAASDAFTYAPEGFGEFFNQRRRWMPSTIANILDLLTDYRNTVTVNSNISMLYIFYQAALMVSTVIGPSTVLMMIAGAIMTVFNVGLLESYLISSAPAVFYSIICFTTKPAYQIIVAELLSAAYAFIMMIVLVGCVITGVMESPFHPSVMFLSSLVIIFAVSALAHPKEFTCIFYGLLYFLCIPSGFLLLVVYSLCNMNNVSWGTREVAQKKTKKQLEEEKKKREEEESLKKKKKGFFSRFWPSNQMGELKDLLGKLGDLQFSKKEDRTTQLLEQMNKNLKKLIKVQSGGASHDDNDDDDDLKDIVVEDEKPIRKGVQFSDDVTISMSLDSDEEEDKPIKKVKRDDLKNPAWIEENCLGKGMVLQMYEEECDFWKKFISKYLKPIEKNEKKEKQMTEALKELRNSACFGMMMINLLWMAINFMFQLKQPTIIDLPTYKPEGEIDNDYVMKVDALGLLFVMFFVIILVIQLVGMFIHRWGTFLHLISITELTNPLKNSMSKNKKEEEDKKDMIDFCEKIMSEPMPDYSSDEDGDDAVDQEDEEMKQRIHNKSKFGMDFDLSKSQRDFGKSLRQTMLQTPAGGRSVNLRQSMAAYLKQSRHQTAHGDEAPQGRDLINRFRSTLYNRQKLEERDENTPPALPSRRGQYSRRAFGYRQGTKLDMMNRARRRRLGQQYLSGERRRESPREMGRDDSDIYETIPFNGTMGRNFAKRLKKFKMAAEFDGNGNPRGYRDYRDYQRNNDGTMNHGFEMHDIESGYRNSQDAYL